MRVRIPFAVLCLGLAGFLLSCGGSSSAIEPPAPVVAPTILLQPQSQIVWAPAVATFTVQAAGTAPLGYQWARNGAIIPDAVAAAFTTNFTNVDDHGAKFTVKVSNAAGSVTSTFATLSVNQLPFVMQQPDDIVTVEGKSATFTTLGQGSPAPGYQWKRNGTAIAGATGPAYSIPAVTRADNQAQFSAIISNSLGAVETRQALLQVGAEIAPPVITLQPIGGSAAIGQTVSLYVSALGTPPLRYQWRKNLVALAGANQSSLTLNNFQAVDAGVYSVVIANDAGSVTSADAILKADLAALTITTQPKETAIGTGQSATFTVVAVGSPPIQYQWLKNGIDIVGAIQASYTTPPAVTEDNLTLFKVRLTNPAGTQFSLEVYLRVYQSQTVTGMAGTFWQASAGASFLPRNLQTTTIEALQLSSAWDFYRYPGSGAADGTFQIPGLLPGPYMVILPGEAGAAPTALNVRNGDADFRTAALGRADGILATGSSTSLTVNVTGAMRGLTKGLWVYVPELGILRTAAGAGSTYRYSWVGLPVPESDKDVLWGVSPLLQILPAGEFTSLAGAGSQPAPSMKASGGSTVDLAVAAASEDSSLDLSVNAKAYVSGFPQINPALDPTLGRGPLRLAFGAQPAGEPMGPLQPWAPLFSLVRTATEDLAATTFSFADPYPDRWQRALQVRQEFSFDLPHPAGGSSVPITDALEDTWPLEGIPRTPLAPLLSPVLQPKLGGANLFSPPAGLGVTPIVSWQTQGRAPSFVRVTVYEVLPTGTRLAEKIHYIATASSQKITPGILETGKFYLLRLQSTWGQTHDPARPFLPSWPRSTVPVYSGIFTP